MAIPITYSLLGAAIVVVFVVVVVICDVVNCSNRDQRSLHIRKSFGYSPSKACLMKVDSEINNLKRST